ncbi:MAG: ATP-binding protein, partial [Myxococcota bacterium]
SRKRRDQLLFALFALNVGLWYFTSVLTKLLSGTFWARANFAFGVLLPMAAVQFFRVFVADDTRWNKAIHRGSLICAGIILATTPTPLYRHLFVRSTIVVYVSVFLFASLAMLYLRSRSATSKFEAARLMFLALVGGLAGFFAVFEYLPFLGVDIPPVGSILVLIFLYMLHQSVLQLRLIDLYELAGRLAVLTALSFTLAGILWLLADLGGRQYFLHAVVAALVVLVLFDPVRRRVLEQIGQILFRERFDLDRQVQDLRRQVAHVLQREELSDVLMNGLEQSRRVTHASIYLGEESLRRYDVVGFVGPEPVARLEMAPAGPLLERIKEEGYLVLENIERQLAEQRNAGEDRDAETLYEISQTMDAMHSSLCLALQSQDGDLYGLLSLRDQRMRDAFSPEEIGLLMGLAAQTSIALENSRLYQQLKERDRLAALGEMAAGLAHEIRNPLGAIKASAQYLTDGREDEDDEFLDIIVEEVDRLNRVVGSFLDYARPSRGNPSPTDINAAIERTLHLLKSEVRDVAVSVDLAEELPKVRIDLEQLRQVLINLIQNALQAMDYDGDLHLSTVVQAADDQQVVKILVHDTGPGIAADVRAKLFVPFVTTKQRGTGLGLAISQRIVSAAGGRITVRTNPSEGTTFVIELPAYEPAGSPSTASNSESAPSPSSDSRSAGAGDAPRSVATSR